MRRVLSAASRLIAVLCLTLAVVSAVTFADIPDVASREIELDASFPADRQALAALPQVFGQPGGRVCVLATVGFKAVALYSGNRGQTFEPLVDILGGPGAPRAMDFVGHLSADGHLYVAVNVEDPDGGRGSLMMVRSDDMGRTWSPPVRVLRFEDPGAGAYRFRDTTAIDSAPGGRVVVTVNWFEATLVSSADYGDTWTSAIHYPGDRQCSEFYAADLYADRSERSTASK